MTPSVVERLQELMDELETARHMWHSWERAERLFIASTFAETWHEKAAALRADVEACARELRATGLMPNARAAANRLAAPEET